MAIKHVPLFSFSSLLCVCKKEKPIQREILGFQKDRQVFSLKFALVNNRRVLLGWRRYQSGKHWKFVFWSWCFVEWFFSKHCFEVEWKRNRFHSFDKHWPRMYVRKRRFDTSKHLSDEKYQLPNNNLIYPVMLRAMWQEQTAFARKRAKSTVLFSSCIRRCWCEWTSVCITQPYSHDSNQMNRCQYLTFRSEICCCLNCLQYWWSKI